MMVAAANIWGADTAKAIDRPFPDCSRCRRPSSAKSRIAWGCDAEAPRPVFTTSCAACGGGLSDEPCSDCNDTGLIEYSRCPSAILREVPVYQQEALDALLRCYIQYDSRQVLPVAGGYGDQSPFFARCVDLLDREHGRYLAMEQEKRERDRKAAEMRQQAQRNAAPRRRR